MPSSSFHSTNQGLTGYLVTWSPDKHLHCDYDIRLTVGIKEEVVSLGLMSCMTGLHQPDVSVYTVRHIKQHANLKLVKLNTIRPLQRSCADFPPHITMSSQTEYWLHLTSESPNVSPVRTETDNWQLVHFLAYIYQTGCNPKPLLPPYISGLTLVEDGGGCYTLCSA